MVMDGILLMCVCVTTNFPFLVHDIFIHQRIKWWRNTDNFYLRAIRRAHKVHHKKMDKENGKCFGMLLVPMQYFLDELKRKK